MKIMSVECRDCHHYPVKVLTILFISCLFFEACFGGIMWWIGREQGRTERAWSDGKKAQVATEAVAREERKLRRVR